MGRGRVYLNQNSGYKMKHDLAPTPASFVFDHILECISVVGEYISNNPIDTFLIYISTVLVISWIVQYIKHRAHRHCFSKEEQDRFLRQWCKEEKKEMRSTPLDVPWKCEHGDLEKQMEGMKGACPYADEKVRSVLAQEVSGNATAAWAN